MKAMIKHFLPLLIVCLLCGAILVSCGPEPAPNPGENPGTEEPAPNPGENPGTEEPDPAPEQPDDSFSGKDFTKYY